MAESTMEIKHSGPTLDVSVSFGRFQSDSLSWEKWSSFSPNKYLEEVEKCSTPGSVAQKKAYFEAHYKMIAARKASEQMELEKLTESDSQEVELDLKTENETIIEPLSTVDLASDLASCSDFVHSNGKDVEVETYQISSSASSQENVQQSESLDHLQVSNLSLQEPSSLNETMEERKEENNHLNESKIKADQKTEMEKTQKTEKEKKTLETEMEKTQKIEMEKTQKTEMVKKTQEMEMKKKNQKTAVNIKDDSKLDAFKKSQKVRNSAEIKKKPTSTLIRSPQVLTQKIPKQLSTSMMASSSSPYQSSLSLRKSKTPATDSKRIAPSSLHLSMSLGHSNSNPPASSSTRKSLIMEKMGDKDIVKRAFRTFQNSFNQLRSPADEKSTQRKQVSASSSVTLRKENDSTRKTPPVKTDKTLRSQPGSKETKSSPVFVKAPAVDQRKAKPAPDRTEILKSGKKLEDKTANNKREGKTNISPNPKVGEGMREPPKPKLNLNKANSRPNLYQAKSTLKKKSLLEMEGAKLEKHYQPEPRV